MDDRTGPCRAVRSLALALLLLPIGCGAPEEAIHDPSAGLGLALQRADAGADADAVLAALRTAFANGHPTPSDALTHRAFQPLLDDPTTRGQLSRLVRDHAREASVRIGTDDEPGEPFSVDAVLRTADGAPAAGALVFAYQADHRGHYAPEADTPGAGNRNPKLFGWLRTGSDGRIQVRTVLPGGYGGAPPHFHVSVAPGGAFDGPRTGGSLYFDGGWPIHEECREDAARGFAWLLDTTRTDQGWQSNGTLQLRPVR